MFTMWKLEIINLAMYIEEKAKTLLTNLLYIEKFRLVRITYKHIKFGF